MKKVLFYLVVFVFVNVFYGQTNKFTWIEVSSMPESAIKWDRTSMPNIFDLYEIDLNLITTVLLDAPHRNESMVKNGIVLELPYYGKLYPFEVYNAPVLASELQEQLPNVNSYIGRLIGNPNVLVRFSLSIKGFNAVILNGENGTHYIDSYTKDNNYVISFSKSDMSSEDGPVCLNPIEDDMNRNIESLRNQYANRNVNDGVLREFRLALSCTEEYATFHINQLGLGGATDAIKKDAILNIMNDIMTRVNAVYENELSLTMTIVDDNRDIIFLTDTFLTNDDIGVLIDQSQTWIDIFLGAANYDIGHMLSTSGSGLAQVFSPCTNNKARAVSGGLSGTPQGVVFENVIMHEMGHQYGARHTYNADNCAGPTTPSSAFEPGGGTTIMSYAGICGASANIQSVADTYFHQNSIDQMWLNLTVGNSTCAQEIVTNNNAPVANAGENFTIPIQTPYKLVAIGSDSEGLAPLTYTWEQLDLGPSLTFPTNFTATGPIVRSFPPSENSTRFIPRLNQYVNNVNQSTSWERLSQIERDINFVLTVRDNDLRGGQIDVDFMTITVDGSSAPFRVTSQNASDISYTGGTMQTITWNEGNTNLAPFNVSTVNILLSTDGGLNYDTVLLSNTPNDSSQEIQLPNIDAASCRIMVEAVGNIFYNINTTNFQIDQNLSLEDVSDLDNLKIYPNPNNGTFTINFNSTLGGNKDVKVNVFDISGRLIYKNKFTNESLQFSETVNLDDTASGLYIVNISQGSVRSSHKLVVE